MTDSEDHEPLDPNEQHQPGQNETSRLTRRQVLALPTLAVAPNLTQAARDAGISESTLRRWLQDERFRDELDRLTHEIAETTRQGLKDVMLQSFSVIKELMADPDPTVRLRAARAAVILGIQVCKVEDLRRENKAAGEACSGQTDERKDRGTKTG